MTVQIPVVDHELALSDDAPVDLLDAVRAAAEQIGIIQVVNHGVPQEVIDGFHQSVGRVLALPRADKEKPASPTGHPWLRPGRHRVVSGGSVTRRSSGVFLYPTLDTVVEPLPPFADPDESDFEPVSVWEQASGNVQDYLKVFGRPEQVAAWREGRPYIAEVAR